MYKQRLHVFITLCILAIVACLGRLAQLQLSQGPQAREEMEQLRIMPPTQLATVRGSILDRTGRVLAIDRPSFFIHVNYELTRLLDDRLWQGRMQELIESGLDRDQAELELRQRWRQDNESLRRIINACSDVTGLETEVIEDEIRDINESIWTLRRHISWRRKNAGAPNIPNSQKERIVPLSDILETDLAEMHLDYPIVELETDEQLLRAQIELADIAEASIRPRAKRTYPYGPVASQIIGWVGPVRLDEEGDIFPEDKYSRYLAGEMSGKFGIERACEFTLRGIRGEVIYNKDRELIGRRETRFGKDATISLDIELQKRLETLLADPNSEQAIGAVVIDVPTGDILAMVSVPTLERSTARREYTRLLNARPSPLVNRAIARDYNPGSTVKPIILIAGLEEKKVSSGTIISCPFEDQKKHGFPNCILFRLDTPSCHDWRWQNEGGNNARNAIRGSCNVYFSRVGHWLDSRVLQEWLFRFGFGQKPLQDFPYQAELTELDRTHTAERSLNQAAGLISHEWPSGPVETFEDVPGISRADSSQKRLFGIGQGSLRASVLQIANATAAIARDGVFKRPRLFITENITDPEAMDLSLSASTVRTVRDGMHAVVYESGGTANRTYKESVLAKDDRGMTLFGKTGSTQQPDNALYSGFVEDDSGRAIALALLVEGGQSGARDAAPRAFDIIRICNEMGYIGRKPDTND